MMHPPALASFGPPHSFTQRRLIIVLRMPSATTLLLLVVAYFFLVRSSTLLASPYHHCCYVVIPPLCRCGTMWGRTKTPTLVHNNSYYYLHGKERLQCYHILNHIMLVFIALIMYGVW